MDMFQIHIYKEQAGSSIAKVSACALHILRPSPNCAEKVTNQWKNIFKNCTNWAGWIQQVCVVATYCYKQWVAVGLLYLHN